MPIFRLPIERTYTMVQTGWIDIEADNERVAVAVFEDLPQDDITQRYHTGDMYDTGISDGWEVGDGAIVRITGHG